MKGLAAMPLLTPVLLALFLAVSVLLTGSLESRAVEGEEAEVVLSIADLASGDLEMDEGREASVVGNCVMGWLCHEGGCSYMCGMPPLCDDCEFCICC